MKTRMFPRALVAVALLAGFACGSDGGDAAAFCEAANKATRAANSGEDPAEPFEKMRDTAPDSVKDVVTAFGDAMAEASQAQDDSGFVSDAFRTPAAAFYRGVAAECDFNTVGVEGKEYAFAGLGDRLPAGETAFKLDNSGAEVHQLYLYRRGANAQGELVDVLNSNPSADDGRLTEMGVTLPAEAGETSYLLADLTAGDYVAVCFIKQGTSTIDDLLANGDSDGTEHRELGMATAFTVT